MSLITITPENGTIETLKYDERDGKMIVKTTYDNSSILEQNLKDRNNSPEFGRYKGDLVHVGRLHMGDVTRLANIGYDIMSPDQTEVRRALLYIQSNEPHLLTVPGKPFSATPAKWI